jgi:hypothetical protein
MNKLEAKSGVFIQFNAVTVLLFHLSVKHYTEVKFIMACNSIKFSAWHEKKVSFF